MHFRWKLKPEGVLGHNRKKTHSSNMHTLEESKEKSMQSLMVTWLFWDGHMVPSQADVNALLKGYWFKAPGSNLLSKLYSWNGNLANCMMWAAEWLALAVRVCSLHVLLVPPWSFLQFPPHSPMLKWIGAARLSIGVCVSVCAHMWWVGAPLCLFPALHP